MNVVRVTMLQASPHISHFKRLLDFGEGQVELPDFARVTSNRSSVDAALAALERLPFRCSVNGVAS